MPRDGDMTEDGIQIIGISLTEMILIEPSEFSVPTVTTILVSLIRYGDLSTCACHVNHSSLTLLDIFKLNAIGYGPIYHRESYE